MLSTGGIPVAGNLGVLLTGGAGAASNVYRSDL
jgi:hypothetical protein